MPRIAIIGSRGIPAKYGGFETFAEQISLHLIRNYNYPITVVCDSEQKATYNAIDHYLGVHLRYSRYSKSHKPILYYLDSIRKVVQDHDIIYSCGPAGAIFGPFVRWHDKIIMVNPDGLNSKRQKWSIPIRKIFAILEWSASRFSDRLICDSYAIEQYYKTHYKCKHTFVAEYGAHVNPYLNDNLSSDKVLSDYGLITDGYHLVVSRLEPENNVDVIIRGYQMQQHTLPLVIIGNQNDTKYVKHLKQISRDNVRFLDGIYDKKKLSIVRAHARCYLHGHSVGGTNPSLLEAMASRNLCICHDNVYNREVMQDQALYFDCADTIDKILNKVESQSAFFDSMRQASLERVINYYNWNNISSKYDIIFSNSFITQHL